MTLHTRTFTAADGHGRDHTLYVYTTFRPVRPDGDPADLVETGATILTASNQPVGRVGQGEYRVLENGQLLHSAAPDAP